MSHDQETYRRACTAVLLGLGTQLVLSILTALTGLYAGSIGINALFWYYLGGLPIWIILWLLYNQHRLERVEALETEQLAADDARTAALFEEAGEQLLIAQRRLDRLYKYGLNIVSLLVSVFLLAMGAAMLRNAVAVYRAGSGVEPGSFFRDPGAMIRAGGGVLGGRPGTVAIVAVITGFPTLLISR